MYQFLEREITPILHIGHAAGGALTHQHKGSRALEMPPQKIEQQNSPTRKEKITQKQLIMTNMTNRTSLRAIQTTPQIMQFSLYFSTQTNKFEQQIIPIITPPQFTTTMTSHTS